MLLVGLRHHGPAVAWQIWNNEREALRERRRYAVPHDVGLRVAVQEQQRRPATARPRKDFADRRIDPLRSKIGEKIGEIRHGVPYLTLCPCGSGRPNEATAEN